MFWAIIEIYKTVSVSLFYISGLEWIAEKYFFTIDIIRLTNKSIS